MTPTRHSRPQRHSAQPSAQQAHPHTDATGPRRSHRMPWAAQALLALSAGWVAVSARAAPTGMPPPSQAMATDVTMAFVNKRQSGSFTLRWQPARDATGRELRAYDILVSNCAEVRSASGAPLPRAVGGRLFAVSGAPYAVALSSCNCNAAASVQTAPVPPATLHSPAVAVARGAIFGPPCR